MFPLDSANEENEKEQNFQKADPGATETNEKKELLKIRINQRQSFTTLPKLVSNYWARVICLPQPPKTESCSVTRLECSSIISAHCNLCLSGSNWEIPGRGATRVTSATLLASAAVLPVPQHGASQCGVYGTVRLGWSHSHKENSNWKC
ncbi:hypothetical protein AAY473_009689 [Plecturocebus cupreus]